MGGGGMFAQMVKYLDGFFVMIYPYSKDDKFKSLQNFNLQLTLKDSKTKN